MDEKTREALEKVDMEGAINYADHLGVPLELVLKVIYGISL